MPFTLRSTPAIGLFSIKTQKIPSGWLHLRLARDDRVWSALNGLVVAKWEGGHYRITGNGKDYADELELFGAGPERYRTDYSGPCLCCTEHVTDLRGHECRCADCLNAMGATA